MKYVYYISDRFGLRATKYRVVKETKKIVTIADAETVVPGLDCDPFNRSLNKTNPGYHETLDGAMDYLTGTIESKMNYLEWQLSILKDHHDAAAKVKIKGS